MKNTYSFKKFLMDEIGLYGTIPDCGSYKSDLRVEFSLANEAFTELDLPSLKEITLQQMRQAKFQMNEMMNQTIKNIENY